MPPPMCVTRDEELVNRSFGEPFIQWITGVVDLERTQNARL
jgi:hypothetical protein